ncbi:hypothetical protein SUDANB126_00232 [Streptomyces sp. enrichment culture]
MIPFRHSCGRTDHRPPRCPNLMTSPDLLVLDEPTNHVALGPARDPEAALPARPGVVVAVSHARCPAGQHP